MTRSNDLTAHLFRLAHLARSAVMKRVLTEVDPNPHLNFWRLINGNQLDIAILEWCKVFGSDIEPTHWKKVVPFANHDKFRNDLFTSIVVAPDAWNDYWKELKAYRDNLVAHHIGLNRVATYPVLDLALKSSFSTTATSLESYAHLGKRSTRMIFKRTAKRFTVRRVRLRLRPSRQQQLSRREFFERET